MRLVALETVPVTDGIRLAMSTGYLCVKSRRYPVPLGAHVRVSAGQAVEAGALLATWNPTRLPVIAQVDGELEWVGLDPEEHLFTDELTGSLYVFDDSAVGVTVRIVADGKVRQSHPLRGRINLRGGKLTGRVQRGEVLAEVEQQWGFQSSEAPLPGLHTIKEEYLEDALRRGPMVKDEGMSGVYGLIKLMASMPVEEVLDGLPPKVHQQALSVCALQTDPGQSFITGDYFGIDRINFDAQGAAYLSAESRFAVGLSRLRAWAAPHR